MFRPAAEEYRRSRAPGTRGGAATAHRPNAGHRAPKRAAGARTPRQAAGESLQTCGSAPPRYPSAGRPSSTSADGRVFPGSGPRYRRRPAEIAERNLGSARLQQRADDLDPGPIGRSARLFVAAAPQHARPPLCGVLGKFLGRPGLADFLAPRRSRRRPRVRIAPAPAPRAAPLTRALARRRFPLGVRRDS